MNPSCSAFTLVADDGIVQSTDKAVLDKIVAELGKQYKVTHEDLCWHLGLKIKTSNDRAQLKISCPAYVDSMLEKFKMQDCNPIGTPSDQHVQMTKNLEEARHPCPYQEAIGTILCPS